MEKKRKYRPLIELAKTSNLMMLTINNGEELFTFNLYEELKLSKLSHKDNIISQPPIYGFLTMNLHKLELRRNTLEISLERARAKSLKIWKDKINPHTRRPHTDDYCKAMVELDKKVKELSIQYINIKYDLGRIQACVRAFEQRKDLLQTLSANDRKEIKN